MDPFTAMAIVGTGLQIYGQLESAKSQASLLRQQAAIDETRANELLARAEINNEIVRERSQQAMGDLQARTGGASISSGSVLQGLEEVARLAAREITQQIREAEFEAYMIRTGAASQRDNAKEIEKAGLFSAFSTGILGAGRIYKAMPGKEQPMINKSQNTQGGKSILGDN